MRTFTRVPSAPHRVKQFRRQYAPVDGALLLHSRLPKHVFWLFAAAAVYVVFPIIDVPLLGLSLSAPVFFLIVLELFARPSRIDLGVGRLWRGRLLSLAAVLLFTFLAGNFVVGGAPLQLHDFVLLVRYLFWVVVFVASATVVSNLARPGQLLSILGWAVMGLGGLRLLEMVREGALAKPTLLTKNSYGFIFSSFWVFALVLAVWTRGRRRTVARLGFMILLLAMLLNGSRGNWVASAVGFIALVILLMMSGRVKRQAGRVLATAGVLAGVLIVVVPGFLWQHVSQRANTFENLEADRSVLVRRVMVQKALKLFKLSPIVGVGPGRFKETRVDLELPRRLSYYTEAAINRRSAHNSWAQWLAEAGLLGVVCLGYFLFSLVRDGVPAVRRLVRRGHMWALAPLVGMVSMCAHLWVIAGLTGTQPWMVFGLVAGVTYWGQRYWPVRSRSASVNLQPARN